MKILDSKERIAAVAAVIVAGLMLLASFYGTDPEVYLFPRITAGLIAVLALILSYDAFTREPGKETKEGPLIDWRSLVPGLAVGIVYVLLLERVGFYTCSFFAFFAICLIYGKRSLLHPKAFMLKLTVTVISMLVLYVLFWKLLNVRTPTGLLF